MIRLLAISGSLRAASLNTAALRAAVHLVPRGTEIVLDTRLRALPLYDYDRDGGFLPDAVAAFRRDVAASDGLVLATPEYAHGISGPMKNALDWLVGDTEFPGKPVALWNTAPRATSAQAHLREVLATMSARVVEEASLTLPLLGGAWTAETIVGSPAPAAGIRTSLETMVRVIQSRR